MLVLLIFKSLDAEKETLKETDNKSSNGAKVLEWPHILNSYILLLIA